MSTDLKEALEQQMKDLQAQVKTGLLAKEVVVSLKTEITQKEVQINQEPKYVQKKPKAQS